MSREADAAFLAPTVVIEGSGDLALEVAAGLLADGVGAVLVVEGDEAALPRRGGVALPVGGQTVEYRAVESLDALVVLVIAGQVVPIWRGDARSLARAIASDTIVDARAGL